MTFDAVIAVDWSGGNDRGPTPKKDAIWACLARDGDAQEPVYLRNRRLAEDWIRDALAFAQASGQRALVLFDLCFAYPTGFATRLIGREDTLALWDWFAARVQDSPSANNRFDLAAEINTRFSGIGPFWCNGLRRDIAGLPRTKTGYGGHGLPDKRAADRAAPGAFSPWQLAGAGAVGGQVIMGLPTLSRLRHHFGDALTVWPFEPATGEIVMAETYFSMAPLPPETNPIKDAAQVSHYARCFSALDDSKWAMLLDHKTDPQGWVLGAGQTEFLESLLCPN